MSAPVPGTEILRPSPLKWLAIGAISAGLAWIGSVIMPTHPGLAWSCIVFFGACAAAALLNLLPGGSRLLLDADGLEMVSLLRRSRIHWADVARFGETRVGMQRLVAFDLVEGRRGDERLQRINRRVSGFHGALPDTYRLDAGELVRRLDARLQAWRASGAPRA